MKEIVFRLIVSVILAVALFLVTTWLWWWYQVSRISDLFPFGFPLRFYEAWGPCPPGENCSEFNALWLVIDLLFWYLVSTLLVNWFRKSSRSQMGAKI
ncbi:MAG: hypothetical protein HYZ21_07285 [Chloroflexi bacterium]|nr:hypothetical protein [Chloroflexota bacterium]